MKAFIALLAVDSILVVATAGAIHAAEPVGKTLASRPALRAEGSAGNRILTRGSPIYFMDRLASDGGGAGEFEFNDGTKLAISASASITVDDSVVQSGSRFKKLGIKAVSGSFRWISGKSPSQAYQIQTPSANMAIRGTAFDVTIRGGKTYVILLNGNAQFCSRGQCRTMRQSCDFIVNDARSLSETKPISDAFKSRKAAAEIFPYLARPSRVSSRFRVSGGRCLDSIAAVPVRQQQNTNDPATNRSVSPSNPSPPASPPAPSSPPSSPSSPPSPPSPPDMGSGMTGMTRGNF